MTDPCCYVQHRWPPGVDLIVLVVHAADVVHDRSRLPRHDAGGGVLKGGHATVFALGHGAQAASVAKPSWWVASGVDEQG
jgi:hypothetical protein